MSQQVPLIQKRIGEHLCDEIRRGKVCTHHAEMAADIYEVVVRAQKEQRETESQAALDRIVDNLKHATEAV